MLEIDGSTGEGGGQVLRTALSLACVLQKPIRIFNIRAGRDKPGLKAQHLSVCRLLGEVTGGALHGDAIGSTEITFEPGKIMGGKYSFDIGTAGSCTLLMQAALPVLLHASAPCSLRIIGGTHVRGAPTYEYFSEVFLPAAREFGVKAGAKLLKAGFYPKGGGEAELSVEPSALHGAELKRQAAGRISCSVTLCRLPPHVAERERKKIAEQLSAHDFEVKTQEPPSGSAGNAVTIWSGRHGASALGEAGKTAEKVSSEACGAFLSEEKAGAAVDAHLADQLLIYAALAKGKSSYDTGQFTPHLKTNAAVLSKLTGRNIILAAEREILVE
ncbi:RNA 3'-terminal phosphate cyclase [uncultured archaeon]|nr:RNA 3'-terminal phosphate cyclase [uncultured archaeon]